MLTGKFTFAERAPYKTSILKIGHVGENSCSAIARPMGILRVQKKEALYLQGFPRFQNTHWILSPLRLPFRHSGNGHFFIIKPLFRPVARPRLPPIQTNGRKPPTFLPHTGRRYLSTRSSYIGIGSGTRTVARRTYASGNARRASSRFSFDGAFRYASMTTHQPGLSPWKPSLR